MAVLAVCTEYLPGARWDPVLLQGSRAALRVGGVTDDAGAVAAWAALQRWSETRGETLLWGREAAAGWDACAWIADSLGLLPLPAPEGWRCLASAGPQRAAQGPLAWGESGLQLYWGLPGARFEQASILQESQPALALPGGVARCKQLR